MKRLQLALEPALLPALLPSLERLEVARKLLQGQAPDLPPRMEAKAPELEMTRPQQQPRRAWRYSKVKIAVCKPR